MAGTKNLGWSRVLFDGALLDSLHASRFTGPGPGSSCSSASKLTREFDIRNVLTVSVNGVQANIAIEAADGAQSLRERRLAAVQVRVVRSWT